jgi:hypothetical protein
MAVARFKTETTFLRGFAKTYLAEISFSPIVEGQMRQDKVTLADIHQVLRSGAVTESEKEDAVGAKWVAEGLTCDDERLRIWLEVYVDHYRISVVRVLKLVRCDNG